MILGGREEEAPEREDRSRKEVEDGGAGKLISASLDAVRRRRCEGSGLPVLSDGAPMSRMETSSISLLVSLLAILTAMSFPPML